MKYKRRQPGGAGGRQLLSWRFVMVVTTSVNQLIAEVVPPDFGEIAQSHTHEAELYIERVP